MSEIALLGSILLLAATATAQPVTRPAQLDCAVDIALAPDAVRDAIQQWVASEPTCVRHLTVRVVPTDGGFYLSAQEDTGRLRERVVPDAQSAALLVVSWMADDSLGTLSPPAAHDDEPVPLNATSLSRSYSPPEPQRSLIVGGTAANDERVGVRGQIDLFHIDRFTIGAGAGWLSTSRHRRMASSDTIQARLFAAVTFQRGRWSLRGQLGVGADIVDERGDGMDGDESQSGVFPHVEASALLQLDLTRSIGIVGGPLVDLSLGASDVIGGGFLGVRVGL